jgi:hypothetical protein
VAQSGEHGFDTRPPASIGTVVAAIFMSILCLLGFGSIAVMSLFAATDFLSRPLGSWNVASMACAIPGALAPIIVIALLVRFRTRAYDVLKSAYAFLVLVAMPAWGMFINHSQSGSCVIDPCGGGVEDIRALAEPGVLVLAGLETVVALAFAISIRRPEALHPRAEPWLHSALLVGIVMHTAIGVQFGKDTVVGTVLFPFGGAALDPVLAVVLLGTELVRRLRRRGQEAATPAPMTVNDPFRGGGAPLESAPAAPRVDPRTLFGAVLRMPAIAGIYAVIAAVVHHDKFGAVAVFTKTCSHTFSTIPLTITESTHDCHYLCTVAARGHTWLARPERIGVRRGRPIVVNRQLAIANAFEDMLHERTPRFGAFARRVYDRLGLPVSRLIRGPWLADLVFIAMKPAEWLFFVALLLFDPRKPEERIDRMYR